LDVDSNGWCGDGTTPTISSEDRSTRFFLLLLWLLRRDDWIERRSLRELVYVGVMGSQGAREGGPDVAGVVAAGWGDWTSDNAGDRGERDKSIVVVKGLGIVESMFSSISPSFPCCALISLLLRDLLW
jgi:hypothetical protein